jgi:hypothetical protein
VVVSTTRSAAKADRLREIGVDHVTIDEHEVVACFAGRADDDRFARRGVSRSGSPEVT